MRERLSEVLSIRREHCVRSSTETRIVNARLSGTLWEHNELAELVYTGFAGFGRWLARLGVSANGLTYASVVFALGSCVAAALGQLVLAAFAAAVGGACDALDGVVARSSGTVSRFGALLDSTVDRVSDALPLLGIMVFYAHTPLFVLAPGLALLGAIVISYARARAEALGVVLPSLFMRRPERVLLLIVGLFLGGVYRHSVLPAPLLLGVCTLLALFNAAGGVQVLRAARRALGDPPRASGGVPDR
jgi:CDP-diacylglycerol--glycerol-3-phosphate 3-phosphatidyltransferase